MHYITLPKDSSSLLLVVRVPLQSFSLMSDVFIRFSCLHSIFSSSSHRFVPVANKRRQYGVFMQFMFHADGEHKQIHIDAVDDAVNIKSILGICMCCSSIFHRPCLCILYEFW